MHEDTRELSIPEPSALCSCSNGPTEVLWCAGHGYLRSRKASCGRQDRCCCEHSAVRLQSRASGAAMGCDAGVPDRTARCLAPCISRISPNIEVPSVIQQPASFQIHTVVTKPWLRQDRLRSERAPQECPRTRCRCRVRLQSASSRHRALNPWTSDPASLQQRRPARPQQRRSLHLRCGACLW